MTTVEFLPFPAREPAGRKSGWIACHGRPILIAGDLAPVPGLLALDPDHPTRWMWLTIWQLYGGRLRRRKNRDGVVSSTSPTSRTSLRSSSGRQRSSTATPSSRSAGPAAQLGGPGIAGLLVGLLRAPHGGPPRRPSASSVSAPLHLLDRKDRDHAGGTCPTPEDAHRVERKGSATCLRHPYLKNIAACHSDLQLLRSDGVSRSCSSSLAGKLDLRPEAIGLAFHAVELRAQLLAAVVREQDLRAPRSRQDDHRSLDPRRTAVPRDPRFAPHGHAASRISVLLVSHDARRRLHGCPLQQSLRSGLRQAITP